MRVNAENFTTPTLGFLQTLTLNSVTMSVPLGTGGTPAVGTVSGTGFTGGTVTLSGTTLTYSFTSTILGVLPTAVSIQITGLTNTIDAGTYTAEIATENAGAPANSGASPPVTFTGALAVTPPASLGWAATLNGANQSIVDGTAADQQITVDDTTGTGAGWRITVSATTFTNGAHTLPDTGTLTVTGSLTSPTATAAPTTTCAPTCAPPASSQTYPVTITTAPSSPPPVTVGNATTGTGRGAMTIGGHTAPQPIGWWLTLPANAFIGSYTSTITVAVVSGP